MNSCVQEQLRPAGLMQDKTLLCELVGETEHGFGFAVLSPGTLFVRCPPFVMISLGWVIHTFVFQQVLFAKRGREGRMSFKAELQNSL